MCELISIKKKKRKKMQAGNESSNALPESSYVKRKPPPPGLRGLVKAGVTCAGRSKGIKNVVGVLSTVDCLKRMVQVGLLGLKKANVSCAGRSVGTKTGWCYWCR